MILPRQFSAYLSRFLVPARSRTELEFGEVDWHTDFQASYYTDDLRAAREGTSPFMKYLGKVNLESKIAECLFEFAEHLKYGAKLEELSHNQTNTIQEK